MAAKTYDETRVYRLAFELAMEIFEISKNDPKTETYSSIDQIRKSSRSLCTDLAEAYRKKRYPAYFISKVSETDSENSQTNVWIEFSLACNYISGDKYETLISRNEEIRRLLYHMISNPEKY